MRVLSLLAVLLGASAAAVAQSVSIEEMAPVKQPGRVAAGQPGGREVAPSQPGGGVSALPLKKIAIYKNGVALFERSGMVTGDALIHIDFTTAQLNDVLQSLTVTDLGGGTVAGLGYDNSATLGEQLRALHLDLGPDPTVGEFLEAMKGKPVEVRGAGAVVTGKLLNVEVRPQANPRTGERTERRFVSVITDKGALRTVELTPLVEVRMTDSDQRLEIGHYLQILATTHNPPLRHLTLETRGTGKRELRISYIGAMPAWKSNYRVLLTGGAKTATLQGWAVVDNPSDQEWKDVQLTLVSGAPASFIQQISRPNNIPRPEIGMPGSGGPPYTLGAHAAADPMGAVMGKGTASVPIQGGMQVSPKLPAPTAASTTAGQPADQATAGTAFQQEARNSLAPQTNSVALKDLFEYKLDQPRTIHAGDSAVIPILQMTVDAERVSTWMSREPGRGVQLALWLRNTSELTLDQGSFTLMENGVFAGQGQLPLIHAGDRRLATYGQDQETKVTQSAAKEPPFRLTHLVISGGVLTGHHKLFREREFTIENPGATPRTVVLGVRQSDTAAQMGPWKLDTPADEIIGSEPTGKLYRFAVEVAPHSTQVFQVMESHSHPVKTPLEQLTVDNFGGIIHESNNDPKVIAMLQPLADAKKKLAELDAQMKEQQKGIDEVNTEEARLRQNMALLKGAPEEKPLAKRYADEMLAQEDKLAMLRAQREQAQEQKANMQKALGDQMRALDADIVFAKT